MKKSGIIVRTSAIIFLAFFLLTCNTPTGTLHEIPLFPKEFWGEWIRMDTGDAWYFASNYRMVGNSAYTTPVNMERQSQNVIRVTEGTGANTKNYFLYASRIRNSTFGAVAVSSDAPDNSFKTGFPRVAGVPEGTAAIVGSVKNGDDIQTVEIGKGGELEAENIIAGDDYTVTIDGYEFTVSPQTDGDNVGTLTLTSGVNIKTALVPRSSYSSTVDLMRLYSGESYDLTIRFTNVGEKVSSAMEYKLTVPSGIQITKLGDSKLGDPKPRLDGGELSSFMPGQTRDVDITIKCGTITEEFEYMNIGIDTEDFYGKEWSDSVSLKVHREKVTFQVRSNLAINGVVIVPNGKAYYFRTSSIYIDGAYVYAADIAVPKYTKDYLIIFSGASADTEAKYSFAVDKAPGTDFVNYPLTGAEGLNKYWPNGTEGQATVVRGNQEVRAYLMMNQANYYRVRFGAN